MPIIDHPQSHYKKSPGLIPDKTKLLLVYFIIIAAVFSGMVPVSASNNNYNSRALDKSRLNAPKYISKFSGAGSIPAQIKQISIGQKSTPLDTPTPVPTKIPEGVWGVATKIDTHTYTMQVQSDPTMASPQEVLSALNNFRSRHGRGALAWDDKLANFANDRAAYFVSTGNLDSHAGFLDYLNNQDGFKKLGFSSVGENSSYGFRLEGVHLIEWVYAGDDEHNNNQLDSNWKHVGIGINGTATNLIFAGNRL